MQNGDLGMVYLRKNKSCTTCMPYLVTSFDNGKSWSEPTLCATKEAYYVTNNDRVVRLQNGDIYVPVNLHPRTDNEEKTIFGKGQMNFFVSRDDGKSWDLGYPSTVELADGTLFTLWYENRGKGGAKLRYLNWKLQEEKI